MRATEGAGLPTGHRSHFCLFRRQLLHEEKDSRKLPVVLENAAHLTRDQLVEHAEAGLAAYGAPACLPAL